MSLKRYVETRLIEAMTREVIACFERPDLGVAHEFKNEDGTWKVYPHALLPGQTVTPHQANIVATPTDFEQGNGGVNNTEHTVSIFLLFPPNTFEHVIGGNSPLDYAGALREWLFKGGTWGARTAEGELLDAPIEDPDRANQPLGWLQQFGTEEASVPKEVNGAGILLPCLAIYKTRENSRGEIT